MTTRVWDQFLSERDRQHLAMSPPKGSYGFGRRPAVLSVDNYRRAVGDHPEPILDAIKTWPSSTGLEGWAALAKIKELLAAARDNDVPVVHIGALEARESGVASWGSKLGGRHAPPQNDSAAEERYRRGADIVEQAAPLPGEAVFRKTAPSAFFGTALAPHLISLGVDTLIVCGESASGCVRATVVDARSYRFRVIVVEDCVYDRHEATRAMNLFDMDQKYADVLSLQEVCGWLATYEPV